MKHLASMTWKTVGVVALSTLLANLAEATLTWVPQTGYASAFQDIDLADPTGGTYVKGNSALQVVVVPFSNPVFPAALVYAYQTGYLDGWGSGGRLNVFNDTSLTFGTGYLTTWFNSSVAIFQWKGMNPATVNFEVKIFAAGDGTTVPFARIYWQNVNANAGSVTLNGYVAGIGNTATYPIPVNGAVYDLWGSAGGGAGGGGGPGGDNANGGVGAPEPGTVLMGLSALAIVGVPLVFRRRRA